LLSYKSIKVHRKKGGKIEIKEEWRKERNKEWNKGKCERLTDKTKE
jgi:hypothetical protein